MKKIKVIDIAYSGYDEGEEVVLYETAEECVDAGLNVDGWMLDEMTNDGGIDGVIKIKGENDTIQVFNDKQATPDKYEVIEEIGVAASLSEATTKMAKAFNELASVFSLPKSPSGGINVKYNDAIEPMLATATYNMDEISKLCGLYPDVCIIDEYPIDAQKAGEALNKVMEEIERSKLLEKQQEMYNQITLDAELELSEIETTIEYNERYLKELKSRAREINNFLYGVDDI